MYLYFSNSLQNIDPCIYTLTICQNYLEQFYDFLHTESKKLKKWLAKKSKSIEHARNHSGGKIMSSVGREYCTQCNFYEDDLNEFIFTQPEIFVFRGREYEELTWVGLLDELCFLLEKENSQTFQSFLDDEKHRITRIPYLSREDQDIHFQKYMPKSGLCLNQKIDAPRSVKLARKLLDKFKIKESEFNLYIRERETQK